MNIPSDSDEPLFVPDEFEAEHLDEARRVISSNTGVRRAARKLAASVAGQRDHPRQRILRLVSILHGIAVVCAIAISAVTGTWLIGLAVAVMVGLSLLIALRLFHTIGQARDKEPAQRHQSQ